LLNYIRQRLRPAAGLNGAGPIEAALRSGGLELECLIAPMRASPE